jgi:hypothetical protein
MEYRQALEKFGPAVAAPSPDLIWDGAVLPSVVQS